MSWSGKRSYAAAEALADWLPQVVNAVDPWLSTEIEKGAPSMNEIAASLDGCSFGIVCVTPGNQGRPWINYEAGALAKSVGNEKGRVATLLVGFDRPTEVVGPLAQFQATLIDLKDIKRLVRDIDKHTDKPRSAEKVDQLVDALWPLLEPRLRAATTLVSSRPPKRSDTEKIDELLTIIRDLRREVIGPMPRATTHERRVVEDFEVQLSTARTSIMEILGEEVAGSALIVFDELYGGEVRLKVPVDERTLRRLRSKLRFDTGRERLQLIVDA